MELRDYLRVFKAHWLGMLLIVVGVVVATFGWVLLQPKVYTADSTAIVRAATGEALNPAYFRKHLQRQYLNA